MSTLPSWREMADRYDSRLVVSAERIRQLIAAGDGLYLVLTALHLRDTGEEPLECSLDGCDVRKALARWKETTDEL